MEKSEYFSNLELIDFFKEKFLNYCYSLQLILFSHYLLCTINVSIFWLLRKNIKYLCNVHNFPEATFLYVEYCVLAYSIIERLFLLLVNAKKKVFCCKVQYIPALPSPVDTFLAFFSIFLLLKHFPTE